MSQFSCSCWFINVQCLHDQLAPLGDWDISTMSTSLDPLGSGEGAGQRISLTVQLDTSTQLKKGEKLNQNKKQLNKTRGRERKKEKRYQGSHFTVCCLHKLHHSAPLFAFTPAPSQISVFVSNRRAQISQVILPQQISPKKTEETRKPQHTLG